MSTPAIQPRTPAQWLEYAQSKIVSSIPLRQEKRSEQNTSIQRDVYLDDSAIIKQPEQLLYVYTDVFALTKPEITISPPDIGLVRVQTRVLTADTPVHLNVTPGTTGCEVSIYASLLNQPITVSSGGADPVHLDLGPGTDHVGVRLMIRPGQVHAIYQKHYNQVKDEDTQASLETQLQIALALCWRSIPVSISLCSYVVAVTANPALYPRLNIQAVALGQQLAAQAMTGPDMGYAPVLNIDSYKETVRDALRAVAAFEEQYVRFQDKKESLDVQIKAWDTMLEKANTQRQIHMNLRRLALDKYNDARTAVARCLEQFLADNKDINSAAQVFRRGLENWAAKEFLKAAFDITIGVLKFTSAIGKFADDRPGKGAEALSQAKAAIDALRQAWQLPNQREKRLSPATLEGLTNCMVGLEKMYPITDEMVEGVKKLESDPNAKIPTLSDISGGRDGDADASAIVTLAAWEKWCLESDQQVEFGVSQGVEGASAYRLALQKHGVSGKALAQVQAEAVKAGHEYIQAELELIGCNKDIADLKELRKNFKGQEDVYAQAELKFFKRFLAIRTSLVMEMRKLVWAHKYWALEDSTVILDSGKLSADFQADLLTLDSEMESADEKYATDYQPFNWTVPSSDLPSNYGEQMIEGLKGDTHSASFTLAPADPKTEPNFASKFINGSHFRLDGLETFLRGVVPKPEAVKNGVAPVDMQILTSGVYSDIKDGKIFHFTSIPRSVRLSYDLTESGARGDTHIHATFPTKEHAEPTPFTQWTIKLLHPEKLDLSGLTGVDLEWTGKARFEGSSEKLSAT
ncbi:hypothetical protein MW887_003461 [Aspergillus wentii]|nr:hypothetical protein MW887_003461 [Aspergillus wentii]